MSRALRIFDPTDNETFLIHGQTQTILPSNLSQYIIRLVGKKRTRSTKIETPSAKIQKTIKLEPPQDSTNSDAISPISSHEAQPVTCPEPQNCQPSQDTLPEREKEFAPKATTRPVTPKRAKLPPIPRSRPATDDTIHTLNQTKLTQTNDKSDEIISKAPEKLSDEPNNPFLQFQYHQKPVAIESVTKPSDAIEIHKELAPNSVQPTETKIVSLPSDKIADSPPKPQIHSKLEPSIGTRSVGTLEKKQEPQPQQLASSRRELELDKLYELHTVSSITEMRKKYIQEQAEENKSARHYKSKKQSLRIKKEYHSDDDSIEPDEIKSRYFDKTPIQIPNSFGRRPPKNPGLGTVKI